MAIGIVRTPIAGASILPPVAGAGHGVAPAAAGPLTELMVARRCCSAAASSSQPAWLELGRLPRGRGLCPGNATFGVLPGAALLLGRGFILATCLAGAGSPAARARALPRQRPRSAYCPARRALSAIWCGVRPSAACRRAAERSPSRNHPAAARAGAASGSAAAPSATTWPRLSTMVRSNSSASPGSSSAQITVRSR
jgi:hypothetical protein